MKATILLNHTEDTKKVEEEEKTRFLRSILEESGLPIQDFWAEDGPLSVKQRMQLRSLLSNYGIQVLDDRDGRMTIWMSSEGEVQKVAEWHKATYKLKLNLKELDPRKRPFLEMAVS